LINEALFKDMTKLINPKNRSKKTVIITVITLLAGTLSIFAVSQIPVAITLYETPADSVMKPFGPITIEHTFKECLPTSLAKSGFFNNNNAGTNLELYMATYMQAVDQDYQIILDNQILPDDLIDQPGKDRVSCGQNCERNYLGTGLLAANSVQDNKYESAADINMDVLNAGQICIHIRPLHQNPTHPLTIWLDSQNQPVLRLKKVMPLYQAIDHLSKQSPFHIGKELMFGLCLAYIFGLIAFAGIICKSVYEQKSQKQESQTKPQHHKRAGNKRI